MLLTRELAQPIVDKTIAIIGKNVNIMDHNAVIIASGERNRLGTYHEGAAQVVASGHSMEISLSGAENLKGVRPGINLPIAFAGKIIGVVGISGNPEEIRSSGQLVRTTVELMLEQLVLKEQLNLEARAKDSFLHDLLTGEIGSHEELFLARATILGYDLLLSRRAIVIEVDRFGRVVEEKLSLSNDRQAGELTLQQLKETIFQCIKRVFPVSSKDIVAFAGGDKFVVLYETGAKGGKREQKEKIKTIIAKIRQEIDLVTHLNVTVGVGRLYDNYQQYVCSYQEGQMAIDTGKRLWGQRPIYWADEMLVENLITALPEDVLRGYVREVLNSMLEGSGAKQFYEMVDTLEALFEHGLNITRAAQALFVHRNTVIFRLEKLKELSGYRPAFSFRDALQLRLAIWGWRYLRLDPRE